MPDSLILDLQRRTEANERSIVALTRAVADLTSLLREHTEATTKAMREQSESLHRAIVNEARMTREAIRGLRGPKTEQW